MQQKKFVACSSILQTDAARESLVTVGNASDVASAFQFRIRQRKKWFKLFVVDADQLEDRYPHMVRLQILAEFGLFILAPRPESGRAPKGVGLGELSGNIVGVLRRDACSLPDGFPIPPRPYGMQLPHPSSHSEETHRTASP
ncbi:hypothetical protein [Luteimonas terricola]|uniref:hypothetical protein n=1 Tax=Luteimonas terricola TaxID=645597 RepID=UPI0027E46A13|nr:hypothetical protein [Luteimonas terricola]